MTVYDLIKMYADKTEEQQKRVCVGSIWDLADVDAVLDVMGYADDSLDDDKKSECLADAVSWGESDEQVRELLMGNLKDALEAVGAKPVSE